MSGRCPSCNAHASGKFCGQCGAPLSSSACRGCGAEVTPGARFCGSCGMAVAGAARLAVGAPAGGGARQALPYAVAGAAVLVAVLVLAFRGQPQPAPASASATAAPFAGEVGGAPPDLSKMTPREAFDRLFTRVMTASENGDTASANRFMPMALMAYGNLTEVDIDARYDVALIKLHAGDFSGARALADTIRSSEPRHLFGFVLQAALGQFEKQPEQVTAAYVGFLAAADAELKVNRPEYVAHRGMLDSFRQTAGQATR